MSEVYNRSFLRRNSYWLLPVAAETATYLALGRFSDDTWSKLLVTGYLVFLPALGVGLAYEIRTRIHEGLDSLIRREDRNHPYQFPPYEFE